MLTAARKFDRIIVGRGSLGRARFDDLPAFLELTQPLLPARSAVVIRDQTGRLCLPVDVRFSPKAT
jgi:hypothetical protein